MVFGGFAVFSEAADPAAFSGKRISRSQPYGRGFSLNSWAATEIFKKESFFM